MFLFKECQRKHPSLWYDDAGCTQATRVDEDSGVLELHTLQGAEAHQKEEELLMGTDGAEQHSIILWSL